MEKIKVFWLQVRHRERETEWRRERETARENLELREHEFDELTKVLKSLLPSKKERKRNLMHFAGAVLESDEGMKGVSSLNQVILTEGKEHCSANPVNLMCPVS